MLTAHKHHRFEEQHSTTQTEMAGSEKENPPMAGEVFLKDAPFIDQLPDHLAGRHGELW